MDPNEMKRRADTLIWYHTIDLGGGLTTKGIYDHRPYVDRYGLPAKMSGMRVLDVGAASGFFSFEMERRGADVTAVDLPRWMDHDFGPRYEPDLKPAESESYLRDPFLLAREALGSKVERREINVYDLSPETIGLFDLVFCGSVLLHLTDPIRALWRLKSVTAPRGETIVATAIDPDGAAEPRALFVGHEKAFTWWLPNRACFEAMVRSAGFRRVEWISEFRLDFADGKEGYPHGVVRAGLESLE
jgi:tRNA (mo5U34)-methyltransferase